MSNEKNNYRQSRNRIFLDAFRSRIKNPSLVIAFCVSQYEVGVDRLANQFQLQVISSVGLALEIPFDP